MIHSFIVALLDRSEKYHQLCIQILSEISQPLITCEAVVTETSYLLKLIPGAVATVLKNIEAQKLQILYHLEDHSHHLATLINKYHTVPMDLVDACLVHLAELYNTGCICTLDRDFQIYRWKKNRKFENLLM